MTDIVDVVCDIIEDDTEYTPVVGAMPPIDGIGIQQSSGSVVAEYFRVDWETVGRCVSRTRDIIEPEISHRLDNLVNIGIDETSYKKGHKYITVIVNHDTNTVVWAAPGHGKAVLDRFFCSLTEEQRSSIRVVTGDGAG